MTPKALIEIVIGVGGILGMGYGAVVFIHNNAMEPVVSQIEYVHQRVTVDGILSLLEARCDLLYQNKSVAHLEAPLQEALTLYSEANGREFPIGDCQDGRRLR